MTTMTTNAPFSFSAATQAVAAAQTIVLVTHVNPDGDAIGSLTATASALRALGKTVTAAVDGGVPDFLQFLPGTAAVIPALTGGEWELFISLDSSDEARTGKSGVYARAHSRVVMNVDHHPTNTLFGSIHVLLPTAVSTTEILLAWFLDAGWPLALDVAVPLLTGLVTDTRGLRTSNVTNTTLAAAQRLTEAGASLSEIMAKALETLSYSTLELWKFVLPSLEMRDAVIAANITQADAKSAGTEAGDKGDLVSIMLSVREAMISVIFTETPEGQIELSFRSKPGYDVSKVAFSLGGGGHKQASGATIPGPLDAARARVLPLLHAVIQQAQTPAAAG